MSDTFTPIPLERLVSLTLSEIRSNRFLGIPGSLFFTPLASDPFRMERYSQMLESPIGVAAGPHTQLAVNIIAAWLCGARYIELKTIQTLDELEVSKPCIDMQDEGYNCEWSQELRIQQSFQEYLNAWIMIHILRKELDFPGPVGTLFNMSVGYNLEGILKDNVQWFLGKMQNCESELQEALNRIRPFYPGIDQISIPACISNNITLSTMHGCPPDEIGKIGLYLIREKKLHTTIKLNPTLLGKEELRSLLNDELRFTTDIPDLAFEHDLKYNDALNIIRMLTEASREQGLQFSIKLTNTLESRNIRRVFSEKETMMYMSGRALHPISIRLARKLQNDFGGKLDITFSAGIDCFNVTDALSCGLKPLTVCSDLLKPGGYGRLWQYIDNLRKEFNDFGALSIDELILQKSGKPGLSLREASLGNLNAYAGFVSDNPAYRKNSIVEPDIKTSRELDWFDCIEAPCKDTCPTHQDIPEYMYHAAHGNSDAALDAIFRTNPFPSVTGMICDHPCQLKCTRINYDESLHIREIKRFQAEHGEVEQHSLQNPSGRSVAVIGAGPAGLSNAWFMRKAGFEVDVYESKDINGGMVSAAIPEFRLSPEAIRKDIQRILDSGIRLHEHFKVTPENFRTIRESHDAVFIAVGAQDSVKLRLDGMDAEGVLDPLDFLFNLRSHTPLSIGNKVVIIGGGNTAMDAARSAYRIVGKDGSVTIVYRRTVKEMPADKGEIKAVMDEGIRIIELANPERVEVVDGKVASLVCSRNILAMKDRDGRPAPVKVPDSEFVIACDTLIPAIGQAPAIDFLEKEELITRPASFRTQSGTVYIGGDALRGAATAIHAIGDGRLAAMEMLDDLGFRIAETGNSYYRKLDIRELMHKKSIRQYGVKPAESPLTDRRNFNLVMDTLSAEEAKLEASRCLHCDVICNVCVGVCPNLANFAYTLEPVSWQLLKAVRQEDGSITFENDQDFEVTQAFQVLNIRDLCNECGNCTTFCPSAGKPFADKPGLCLSIDAFNREQEAFYLSRLPGKDILIFKHHEAIHTLTLSDGTFTYETDQVRAVIRPQDFMLQSVEFLTPCVKECSFGFAAEMSLIMEGALQLNS